MDKISQLPDELLLKVLLFLPTKTAVSTSILSKRWEFLWMWLPKLEYDSTNHSKHDHQRQNLKRFINLNLPLHKAPVIESLSLKFNGPARTIGPSDINVWVVIAVSHCIRELRLEILFTCEYSSARLPSSLYICKSLVILELKEDILVDVPRTACLPSLKTLFLRCVIYSDENSLHNLLSSCPVLEDLIVRRNEFDDFGTWKVNLPSLQRLTLVIYRTDTLSELVIRTPSLKYFKFTEYKGDSDDDSDDDSDHSDSDDDDSDSSLYSENMPTLEEVDIDSIYLGINKFVRAMTSVKRLSLCQRVSTKEALYREGIVFNQLKHLKLCQCGPDWSKLLARLLKDSPNLREVEVYMNKDHIYGYKDPLVCWENLLNCVPTCLLSSLETFKWTRMYGSQKEIDLVKYILRNGCCLKTVTISFEPDPETENKREMMHAELLSCSRGSTTCQLVFID